MTRVLFALLASLGTASVAHADDDEDGLRFEIDFHIGPAMTLSPGADPDLESGAGFALGAGPRFVSPEGWGFGLDVGGTFELDGVEASYAHFVTDLYALRRVRVGDADFIALRLGPSFWLADAGIQPACVTECDPAIEQRQTELDVHDTTVLAGVAGLSFSRAFGPVLLGADLRGRVGRALADDTSPLRAQVLLVLHVSMRVPPRQRYAD